VRIEPYAEMAAMQAGKNALSAGPLGYTPPGALRAAVAGQGRMQAAAAQVPGAQGTFAPLGRTPLIADDPDAPEVNGLGLADQAGRVDSLVYDDVNDRLFSAPGTGGVWLSTDVGGTWRSVGDTLPFQSVGAVDWSPAGTPADGTLLVLSGEATAGGNNYNGLGAFYSTDTGRTWNQSTGIPDGLMGFEIDVDPTNPNEVYAATSQGLYRSTDTGRSFVNVALPTGDCAGVTGYDTVCQNANWVTDVEIKAPGAWARTPPAGRCWPPWATAPASGPTRARTRRSRRRTASTARHRRAGQFEFLDDIYSASDLSPIGFAPQPRVGRTELGSATGAIRTTTSCTPSSRTRCCSTAASLPSTPRTRRWRPAPIPNAHVLQRHLRLVGLRRSWTRMADDLELQLPSPSPR
jgi:hypothetical protein